MMTDMEEAEARELQSEIEKRNREENELDFKEAVKKLAEGFLNQYQVQWEQTEKKLDEVKNKQETLLNQMQIENKKFQDVFDDIKLNDMFQTIKISQNKLILMKKEMASIHERTFKLKKRALRLQQIIQKEALNREQQREQEIRREQELIGKPMIS
ncbi:biogenesis of lysosome-related organelles complex 1 subunit 6 [Apis mellifera caucasica]|uniref:Biogenesis of lysosome-related organelles complex 1 subunit 6 n=1 Tax=Apis mellifera TaxID=7460 RepID=A0A7M7G1U4_APIME|nr:biogenesis of lysosome-related organelles complex 1 subunit 6 [Apis mellifera]KAG6794627.1 biogenesis of lysosome-related organelles complex 1 subunit 6 [Apis mellifera caucasica]KAG9429492.1 biogenesis of lysosome-related organelles complex 1 subunit 6 [Apis mellifera carnica]|eukprot:XP_001120579.2 biogenesis of lysosome-related organelles complex 1 subunit 6 [Apis mellifera]